MREWIRKPWGKSEATFSPTSYSYGLCSFLNVLNNVLIYSHSVSFAPPSVKEKLKQVLGVGGAGGWSWAFLTANQLNPRNVHNGGVEGGKRSTLKIVNYMTWELQYCFIQMSSKSKHFPMPIVTVCVCVCLLQMLKKKKIFFLLFFLPEKDTLVWNMTRSTTYFHV